MLTPSAVRVAARAAASYERVFQSPTPFGRFRAVAQKAPGIFGKPEGLWYSCGTAWKDWSHMNMPSKKYAYTYRIEINPSSMLLIKDEATFLWFEEKYSVQTKHGRAIDWKEVARNYSGIEICPYRSKQRMDHDWYYPWDVASGCIWAGGAIKSVVEVSSSGRDTLASAWGSFVGPR